MRYRVGALSRIIWDAQDHILRRGRKLEAKAAGSRRVRKVGGTAYLLRPGQRRTVR
jgi:hypothetical protein